MRPSLAWGSLRGLLSLRWGRPGAETCKRRSRRPSGQLPPEGRPREEFARGGCAHSRVVQEGKSELGPGEGFWVLCVLAFLNGLGRNKAGVCRWAGHQGENRDTRAPGGCRLRCRLALTKQLHWVCKGRGRRFCP